MVTQIMTVQKNTGVGSLVELEKGLTVGLGLLLS